MQASDSLTQATSTQPTLSDRHQSNLHLLLQWVRRRDVAAEVGLVVIGVLGLHQILVQICNDCWQIAFLFAFIGLMIFSLFGQYYFNQTQSKFMNRCTTVLNIIMALFGIGLIACILTTPVIS